MQPQLQTTVILSTNIAEVLQNNMAVVLHIISLLYAARTSLQSGKQHGCILTLCAVCCNKFATFCTTLRAVCDGRNMAVCCNNVCCMLQQHCMLYAAQHCVFCTSYSAMSECYSATCLTKICQQPLSVGTVLDLPQQRPQYPAVLAAVLV